MLYNKLFLFKNYLIVLKDNNLKVYLLSEVYN
jgi:hypothetical protein